MHLGLTDAPRRQPVLEGLARALRVGAGHLQLQASLLERHLRKFGVSLTKTLKRNELDPAVKRLRAHSVDDLVCAVGYGKITAAQIAEIIVPEGEKPVEAEEKASHNPIANFFRRVTRTGGGSTGIKVAGEDDVLVRFGKCCSPLPGDPILGFITRGRGVTIHTRVCPKSLDLDPDRRVEVEWDEKAKPARPVSVQVVCADKPGLLAHISQSFVDAGLNISHAHCRSPEDQRAVNTFQFSVNDLAQLNKVIRSLQRINGVQSVERVAGPLTR